MFLIMILGNFEIEETEEIEDDFYNDYTEYYGLYQQISYLMGE